MDIPAFASQLITFLSPYLPYLSNAGKQISDRLTGELWEKAKAIWKEFEPEIDPATRAEVAENPDDKDIQAILEIRIKKLLEQDNKLTRKVEELHISATNGGVIFKGDGQTRVRDIITYNVHQDRHLPDQTRATSSSNTPTSVVWLGHLTDDDRRKAVTKLLTKMRSDSNAAKLVLALDFCSFGAFNYFAAFEEQSNLIKGIGTELEDGDFRIEGEIVRQLIDVTDKLGNTK